jgi:small subunit ribosomal protein S17
MNEEVSKTKSSSNRIRKTGIVTTKSGNKTVVVKVDRLMIHPNFRRVVKKSKKYMVHDENNKCKVGDKVEIIENKPLSKRKRWSLVKIVEAGK